MSGIKEGFRCGHCGRTFNRSYLHHNNVWCPNCNFFICNECAPFERYCPKCKEKIRGDASFSFSIFLFMAIVFALLQIILIIVVSLTTNQRVVTIEIIITQGMAGTFFLVAIVEYIRIRKRYRIHRDYLVRLPPGEIPVEKRIVISRRRIAPKEDSSIEHKYPTPKDFNLRGDWDQIALSKDEWQQRCKEERIIYLTFSVLSFIGALALVIIPLYFFNDIICGEGVLLIFIWIISFIAYLNEIRKEIKDTPRYIRINLKTAGITRIQDIIFEFLDKHSIEYSCKTVKPDKKYHYLLSEGIVIKLFYSRSAYAQQFQKRLEMHYDSSNYEMAREIQIEMDKFFTQKDIIYQKI